MKIKNLWFWIGFFGMFLILLIAALLIFQPAGAFTIAPDGWMTATAQFEKDTCGWSGVKPDYCPTSTPKPVLQLTQEYQEFCDSTPYQQPGCLYPTAEGESTYPGPIIDDCTVTYPGPNCGSIFGDTLIEPLEELEPTPTPTRWLISRPTNRKARRP